MASKSNWGDSWLTVVTKPYPTLECRVGQRQLSEPAQRQSRKLSIHLSDSGPRLLTPISIVIFMLLLLCVYPSQRQNQGKQGGISLSLLLQSHGSTQLSPSLSLNRSMLIVASGAWCFFFPLFDFSSHLPSLNILCSKQKERKERGDSF